jgi:signal transduction histidine kinase/predicted hydrocarbon binding protein
MAESVDRTGSADGFVVDEKFRDEALRIIQFSLEEAKVQRPLTLADITCPTGDTRLNQVSLLFFRAVRLLAFRELLGARLAGAILYTAGKRVGQSMGLPSVESLVSTLDDLTAGQTTVVENSAGRVILEEDECATCKGLPNIGEPLCHFEAGFVAGCLEGILGEEVVVTETKCWGLGDRICRLEAEVCRKDSRCDDPGTILAFQGLDPVDLLASLAGKAASAVDSARALEAKNKELEEAYSRLQRLEELRDDLTHMIVHDVRNSLTSILGTMSLMEQGRLGPLTGRQVEWLEKGRHTGQHLLGTMNTLLDVGRLEAGRLPLNLAPLDMIELVDSAATLAAPLIDRGGVSLKTELTDKTWIVSADRDVLERVLVNLLENAVKYSCQGDEIVIAGEMCPAGHGGKMAMLSVIDHGEGIPAEMHEAVFEKFRRVPGQSQSGSGLGLAFCKLAVEAHGGRIWIESEVGQGTRVNLTLPISQ